jgi:hypothetical protein
MPRLTATQTLDLIRALRAIGEEEMNFAPWSCKQWMEAAADRIEQLETAMAALERAFEAACKHINRVS